MVLIKAVDGRRRSIKRRGGQSRPRRRAASWCDRVFDCLSFNPVVQNRHPRCPPSRTQAQTQECIPRYHHLSTLALVSLLRQIATPRHTAHSETHTSLFLLFFLVEGVHWNCSGCCSGLNIPFGNPCQCQRTLLRRYSAAPVVELLSAVTCGVASRHTFAAL